MKKAFTLIELLVVIAIIAILAAILFPVLAQAREAAKKAQDLSNVKQLGLALTMYNTDHDDVFSQAYHYANDNDSSGGYVHWSYTHQAYIKNEDIFKSPGDKAGGMAPTNFINNNEGRGAPGGQVTQYNLQDKQVHRISYVPNSALMPRKRRTADPAQVVPASSVEAVAETIALAPMTDLASCINDTSAASGQSWKTHRSAGAFLLADNGNVFTGEATADYVQAAYWAVSATRAKADLAACKAGNPTSTQTHLRYTSPERFGNGANYLFADMHAKFSAFEATLNPDKFLWGKQVFFAGGKPVYRPGTTNTPVN